MSYFGAHSILKITLHSTHVGIDAEHACRCRCCINSGQLPPKLRLIRFHSIRPRTTQSSVVSQLLSGRHFLKMPTARVGVISNTMAKQPKNNLDIILPGTQLI